MTITVAYEDGQPASQAQVGLLEGGEDGHVAFFAVAEQQIQGALVHPPRGEARLELAPDRVRLAGPEEAAAVARMLGDIGFRSEAYSQTLDAQAFLAWGPGTANSLLVTIMDDSRVAYAVQSRTTIGDMPGASPLREASGPWDEYLWTVRSRRPRLEFVVALFIPSQAPVMQSVTVEAVSGGRGTAVFRAVDALSYEEWPPGSDLPPDGTVSLGPTRHADLVYRYRVVPAGGGEEPPWLEVRQKAACTPEECKETRVRLPRLEPGRYILEVYAVDEAGNETERLRQEFTVE